MKRFFRFTPLILPLYFFEMLKRFWYSLYPSNLIIPKTPLKFFFYSNHIFSNCASVSLMQKISLKSPKPLSHSTSMPFPRYRLKYRFLKIEACQIAFHRLTTVSRGAIISAVRHEQAGTYQVGPETRIKSNQVTSEFSEAILAFASVLGDHLPFGQSALDLKDDSSQHQNQKVCLPFCSKKKLFDPFCNENRALISKGKPPLVSSSPVYSPFRKTCVYPISSRISKRDCPITMRIM